MAPVKLSKSLIKSVSCNYSSEKARNPMQGIGALTLFLFPVVGGVRIP